ncbi:hypothetical protein ABPG74_009356 [Tetrahymena malaccensis]
MDQILKNTYTNIPTCISDALKELYLNQKKLQEETKGVVSQTKSLLSSYEKDVNSLRNEVNIGQINFKLYCQTTTDKLESIKNNLSNEVYMNIIKNEDWQKQLEKRIFEDNLGWSEGANHVTDALKQIERFQSDFRVFKQTINEQKLDICSFKEYLLDNIKNNNDLIKQLSKSLKLDQAKQENDKQKQYIQDLFSLQEQKNAKLQEIEQLIKNKFENYMDQVKECSEKLNKYIFDNDNYVSNLYKHIFDVNKDFRSIKEEIDEKRKSFETAVSEFQKGITTNSKYDKNSDKISQPQSQNQKTVTGEVDNKFLISEQKQKKLEQKNQELFDELKSLKESYQNQFISFKQQIDQKQVSFLDQIREDIKQSLQVHIQNIQENYFEPLINIRNQISPINQYEFEGQEENFDAQLNKKNYRLQKNQKTIDEEEQKSEQKNSLKNTSDGSQIQNKEETFSTIRSQPQEEDDDEMYLKQGNNKNANNLNKTIKVLEENTPGYDMNGQQQENNKFNSKKSSIHNTSQQYSKRELAHKESIDLVDVYKVKNTSPEPSPLKAKYSNIQQNKGNQSNSSKGEMSKNNVTVASFKKRKSVDNYSQYIQQNSQESQENFQQNLSYFYTEQEEDILNQINSNNKNHLHISKRKSLQTQQMFRNTPKMQGGSTMLNKTLPDLSFDNSTSPNKKWPPLENAGIHQKIQNIQIKNLNSTNYTVMSHSKQNKMSILNLSLDFINPQAIQNQQNLSQSQANGFGNIGSFSNQLQNIHQPVLQLANYGNKMPQLRAQKLSSNNPNKDSNLQRPFSQQSHRNSAGGIFINKSQNKIQNRPKTQESIQIIGHKK